MTRQLLEDYPHICEKIRIIEQRQKNVVTDTVNGSDSDPPYLQHTMKIRGVAQLTPKEEATMSRLQEKKTSIEAWVESLPTEREKLVVELHALQGIPWKHIFRRTKHATPEAARKFYGRTLEKNL